MSCHGTVGSCLSVWNKCWLKCVPVALVYLFKCSASCMYWTATSYCNAHYSGLNCTGMIFTTGILFERTSVKIRFEGGNRYPLSNSFRRP